MQVATGICLRAAQVATGVCLRAARSKLAFRNALC
jgi:hypothetical protein